MMSNAKQSEITCKIASLVNNWVPQAHGQNCMHVKYFEWNPVLASWVIYLPAFWDCHILQEDKLFRYHSV